ncbi:MAG TPA: OsmC family protein [Planococcus sp. (in: firmicutes)]|nr:OsmC family protein [Planococcus sp. (in: firmicutes)]
MGNRSDALLTTAAAITIDGPGGESYMEDGSFSTLVSLPREMGGTEEGFSPAKFLALSCSSSFSFTLATAMKETGSTGRTRISCKVSMVPDDAGGDSKFAMALDVSVKGLDLTQVQSLADNVFERCPFSKAVKGNAELKVRVVPYKEEEPPIFEADSNWAI